jgi:anti-sigma factor RsiW
MQSEMKCKKPDIDLFSFAEGLLPKEESAAIERHLEGCESCRRVLEEVKGVLAVIGGQKRVEENPFFFTRVESRMLRPVTQPLFTFGRLVPTMVAVLFFAGGVFAGINFGKLYSSGSNSSKALVYETKQFLDDFTQEPIESYIIDLYTHSDDTN